MKIQLGQKSIYYNEAGAGETLLLVHGFPLDHSMWIHQLEELGKRFRVVAPDLPGFGQSTLDENPVSMRGYADDLAGFLDVLKIDRVHFCGLSMGGYIGWQFWKHYRHRLASLVACDTRAAADDEATARARGVSANSVRTNGSEPMIESLLPKLFAKASFVTRVSEVSSVRSVVESTDVESIALAQLAMANRSDATDWLAEMKLPVLLIVGDQDQITTPDEMLAMSKQISNVEFAIIQNAGHMTPLENPDTFNQLVREFLEELND